MLGKDLIQNWWRNRKFYRQAEAKRIEHHQTNLATNTEGTYIASKYTRKTYKNKHKTTKKMPVGTYVSLITLNINGLMHQPKDTDWLNGYKNKTLQETNCCLQRPTSDLETHTDWKQKDGKRYSMQT